MNLYEIKPIKRQVYGVGLPHVLVIPVCFDLIEI